MPDTLLRPEAPQAARPHPLTGNEAIARGVWEAGARVAAAYPGTPSTEIMENIGTYPEADIHAQWATNEKTSLDTVIGASFAGVRAFSAMKHVGLNVAADALMSFSYIGVNAGLVIAVCDDPGIHSSQNEQDTRIFGRFAHVPVMEPSDGQEALEFTRLAFDLSEEFDTPVILRSTTRLSHTRSGVKVGERTEVASVDFQETPSKNVMIPAHARGRHPVVLEREKRLADYLENNPLNRVEMGDTSIGIVTSGITYTYVKECLPDASVLKLGVSHPLAENKIRAFCASVDRVIVVEELEPVLENSLKVMGIDCEGKSIFPRTGEFSPEVLRECLAAAGLMKAPKHSQKFEFAPMIRPPVLCAGCPHTSCFMALRALDARVAGDIGCYTLAVVEPLKSMDTCVAMGSSIANAVGMAMAGTETRPIVATIGDSTFLHSGIPPLIDAVYNNANITIFLLDNHITAMTGGQDHPGTGRTLRGDPAPRVDYIELIKSLGVEWVKQVDSYDMAQLQQQLREAIEYKGVSVVISDRPCVLDPVKIKGPAMYVDQDSCIACQGCMNLGCPAMTWSDEWFEGRHKVKIDEAACIGCSLCAQICTSDSIRPLVKPEGSA
ncbi:indolepyruvate ferredoxin oxidoreductase subunit alpha [Alisedimentitalea sp. MJ-SS2]|uniref:indolepyruvate ferredoxin oxidoreductase subunit alpha n=1 Tax=Aliisedimentitalea sp. MJ-SS2 TaxID=3049795 RepID=UPI002911506C|nr:indolepyruvate ferredoxin oxidoreductase subunit alpha [Alisedimentitalea sp. MJ-SS2]MDU8927228.1 indolepyruvate ferredoxin oxidoreductase subunit alpha [Alisedimentitalea sp. MJ-SS2]